MRSGILKMLSGGPITCRGRWIDEKCSTGVAPAVFGHFNQRKEKARKRQC